MNIILLFTVLILFVLLYVGLDLMDNVLNKKLDRIIELLEKGQQGKAEGEED